MNKSNKPVIKHVADFLEYCEVEKGLSPVTTKNYHNFLKMFINWLNLQKLGHILPHNIDSDLIWQYRLYLSRKKDNHDHYIKKTTQNYYLIALRNLIVYFATKDIVCIPANKITLPKLTDKDKKIKFLKSDQVDKLMSMPDLSKIEGLRDRAILETLYSTGMRVSELTSLNMRLFNTKNITENKLNDLEISITGKGGTSRTVYFSKDALIWLGKYLKTRTDMYPPLFINYKRDDNDDEHRLTPRSIERLVKKYTTMAGLPVEATPHTLRHSFATDLLEQGADMRSVQEMLGHKNIVTTQIYTHVTNPHLREIHRKYHGKKK